jgi:CBS domain-containing protein
MPEKESVTGEGAAAKKESEKIAEKPLAAATSDTGGQTEQKVSAQPASQSKFPDQIVQLSEKSFQTFCQDISGLFGVEVKCNCQQVAFETVEGLRKRFNNLVVVSSVKAEGLLAGTFRIIFDRAGLFILAGLTGSENPQGPEAILENIEHASLEDAKGKSDALTEAGNLLIGGWDRVFREQLPGHSRFSLIDNFIGEPWDKISLACDEDLMFVPCKMTVGTYPSFDCGVIFPNALFAKIQPRQQWQQTTQQAQAESSEPASQEKTTQTSEDKEKPISETIRRMAQSPAFLPGEPPEVGDTSVLSHIAAEQIMQKNIFWASPDDSVKDVLTKMRQHDTSYLMVGTNGSLEAIVSKSDIAGAVSPYLRPIFAKWRRSLDDATLQIRLRWIMSRPVHTIQPQMPLTTVMEQMCRFGRRALPVVDLQGRVQGLVTVFDVFRALLSAGANISLAGRTPQCPPLT